MKYTNAQLVQRGDKWKAKLNYKDGGKWRSKTKVLSATGKREAQRELEAWRDEMEAEAEEAARIEATGSKAGETVAEYVERYIDSRRTRVEASSITGYRTLLRNSIAPYIGGTELAKLTTEDVEAWVSRLVEARSRTTATKALVLLRAALTVAQRRGTIKANPTDTVEKPRARKERPNSLDEVGRGKVAAFVDIDPADPVSIAVRLALFTGMRRGEICGLRWRSVSIEGRTLRVSESLGIASKGAIREAEGDGADSPFSDIYVKEPKNSGSARTICFPESVAAALRARRAAMKADCIRAGVPFGGDLYVCGGPDGRPLHPHELWRRWGGVVTALGLVGTEGKPPTFHDLRHTYATTAIANGADVKTVSNQMGHSNAAMTLNTYASVDPDAARRTADNMDRAYSEAKRRAAEAGRVVELEGTGTDGR